jgi:hypothetical protein
MPKTRKWRQVVAAVLEGYTDDPDTEAVLLSEDVGRIAREAAAAAEVGLRRAADDSGLQYAVYLLTQLVLAARESSPEERLAAAGLDLREGGGALDLTLTFQRALDSYVERSGRHTDTGEMAQQAACEALCALVAPRLRTLFGADRQEVLAALRDLSTKKGFGELGQRFFGSFLLRYLSFFLSRATPSALGTARIPQLGDLNRFNEALRTHCLQTALIVRDFCGGWLTKTEWEVGIDSGATNRFVAVALKKLRAELKHQGQEG